MSKYCGQAQEKHTIFLQAKELGCQIITVPPKIIGTIENFGKTFDKLTKDTVKGFLIDSQEVKI